MLLKHLPKKLIVLFFGDAFLISLAFFLSPLIRQREIIWSLVEPSWTGGLVLGIYLLTFYLADLYDLELSFKNPKYLSRFLVAILIASVFVAMLFFFSPALRSGRGVFLINAGLVGILTYSWRLIFYWWFKNLFKKQKKLLIVGAGWAGKTLYETIKDNQRYKVLGFIDDDPFKWGQTCLCEVLGGCSILKDKVSTNDVDAIIIAITHLKSPELLKCALDCKMDGIEVYDMPSFYEELTGKVPVEHVNDFWFVSTPLSGVRKNLYTLRIKRMLDLILSLFGLICSLLITIPIAIVIKMESSGPVFYRQRRIGLNRRPFDLIKFRSMKIGTENERQFAGNKDDPRITKVGKIIRLMRIDEIPQMWNVLKGQMSFIGPRALMEEEVREFDVKVPYFSLRHSVRPGITGWAQVNYKHGATVEDALEKLQYDLFYIKNLSPFFDFHIILKTVKVVLLGKGAR